MGVGFPADAAGDHGIDSEDMQPPTKDRTTPVEDGFTQVLRWRLNQLVQAGYSPTDATEIAVRVDIDLHDALALVQRGCPPHTALRILV